MKSRLGWAGLTMVALATFFGGGWLLRRGLTGVADPNPTAAAVVDNDLLRDVIRHVRSYAVDSLDEDAIYRLAATGMLDEIDDPYAALVPTAEQPHPALFHVPPTLGMYLDARHGFITVVAVRPAGPAAVAGVRSGDYLLAVGTTDLDVSRIADVPALIASAGGDVSLRLARGRQRSIRVTVPSGPVPPLSRPEARDQGVGIVVIAVHGLVDGTHQRVVGLVDSVLAAGAKALILDLRSVVEGELAEGALLAAAFLPPGTTIGMSRGRTGRDSTVFRADVADPRLDVPIAVLVDQGTAGAAEVTAAALQDLDRALIVGTPSFGRGAELSFFPLGDGTSLRLTTAYWVTPTGRLLQRDVTAGTGDGSTTEEARPTYQTPSGRTIRGGGGVVPDREVPADRGEADGGDPAVALARRLLARAGTTSALLSMNE